MTWRVVISPQVYDDLRIAAEWYDTQRFGLGDEFLAEFRSTAASLRTDALTHQLRSKARMLRWVRIDRFPYQCVYQVIEVNSENLAIIGAVVHTARSPKSWRDRF